MTESLTTVSIKSTLECLHERVNAMLDVPVPKEGDAFPLPFEAAVKSNPSLPSADADN